MNLDINGSPVLSKILKSKARGIVLEGGSRSTKTWSIIQRLLLYCFENNNKRKVITISRQRLTWLKATVLPDFFTILNMHGLYHPDNWHKSEMIYTLFGNEISFIGLDEPQKLHGRKQNIFWINEAVEATIDDFDQLEMRTSEWWILDYNPNRTEHWIFDRVLTRKDVSFIHSTMLDNPFLEQHIKNKILSYEPTPENIRTNTADENKWKIYGLGLRSQLEGAIYSNYAFVKEFPENANWGIGLDFGFTNDPTAATRIALSNDELYLDEIIYDTGLTNMDIANRLAMAFVPSKTKIICDSAEPKSIEELKRIGWNAIGAKKGADSISNGIDILKRYKLNVTERSVNLKTELSNYTWMKDRTTGKLMNVPIDNFNHALDGVRYYALEFLNTQPSRRPRPMVSSPRI